MSRINLLPWRPVTTGTHVKGFNHFSASDYQTGIGALVKALDGSDVKLTHLPGTSWRRSFPPR